MRIDDPEFVGQQPVAGQGQSGGEGALARAGHGREDDRPVIRPRHHAGMQQQVVEQAGREGVVHAPLEVGQMGVGRKGGEGLHPVDDALDLRVEPAAQSVDLGEGDGGVEAPGGLQHRKGRVQQAQRANQLGDIGADPHPRRTEIKREPRACQPPRHLGRVEPSQRVRSHSGSARHGQAHRRCARAADVLP